jgi:hypothetical protein
MSIMMSDPGSRSSFVRARQGAVGAAKLQERSGGIPAANGGGMMANGDAKLRGGCWGLGAWGREEIER